MMRRETKTHAKLGANLAALKLLQQTLHGLIWLTSLVEPHPIRRNDAYIGYSSAQGAAEE